MAENFDGNSFDTKKIYENFNEVIKGKTFFCYKIQKKKKIISIRNLTSMKRNWNIIKRKKSG